MKLSNWWQTACSMCVVARHTLTWVSCLVLFSFSVYGATTAYNFAKDDQPAIELGEGFSSVNTASPGDTVVFYLHVRKLRDCQGRIIQVLTGDCGHLVLRDNPASLPEGFNGRVNHVVHIPFETMPGNCAFKVKARYICNLFDWPLQRQVFESKLIPFTVVASR